MPLFIWLSGAAAGCRATIAHGLPTTVLPFAYPLPLHSIQRWIFVGVGSLFFLGGFLIIRFSGPHGRLAAGSE
jgi:hypothetical protein